jgi:hypothetical protein
MAGLMGDLPEALGVLTEHSDLLAILVRGYFPFGEPFVEDLPGPATALPVASGSRLTGRRETALIPSAAAGEHAHGNEYQQRNAQ